MRTVKENKYKENQNKMCSYKYENQMKYFYLI